MFDISKYLGFPENASAHGAQLDYWTGIIHLVMLFLLLIWVPFFTYVLIRFRASKNPKANYHGTKSHISTYLECAIIVVEVVLLAAFAIPIWAELREEHPVPKDVFVVHVVGEQFAWNIHYPGPDGVFGRRDIYLVDGATNPLGIDESDPNAKDDIISLNELRIPVNKPVTIYLTSKDVIHCFSLPTMRVKQDIIPGLSIPVRFTPIKTGKYDLGCAQLCGLGHYRMHGWLIVETEEEFQEWLQEALQEKEEFAMN